MLTFKLIELDDGYYHYEIYPEGKMENRGEIVFNPETGDLKKRIEPKSPFDCLGHFLSNLRSEDGSLKTSGIVAWY